MSNVLNNLKQVWNQAALSHRLMLIGIAVGFLAVAGVLIYWASQPELALLYGNLDPEDAAQIAEQLRDEGIEYKLTNGGRTIHVESDKVYSVRLQMASEGLPTGGAKGYDLLEESPMGQSPNMENKRFIRALEGELTRTIQHFDSVDTARVHIVSEQKNLFTNRQDESSASVFVKTRGGAKMGRQNVLSIANLVAGAVKGVKPDKVVVVVNGKTEHGQPQDDMQGISSNMFEHKMQVEKYMAGKAQEHLERVLGVGRSSVVVNATLSTETVQTQIQERDPKTIEVSLIEREKKMEGGAGSRGNSSAPATSSKDSEAEIEMIPVKETAQSVTKRPGRLEKASVSVFVDLSAANAPGEGGEGAAPAGAPLNEKDIEEIVRNALGLQESDSIAVKNVPFRDVPMEIEPLEEAGLFSIDNIIEIAKKSSLGIAVLGMLITFKIFRGKKTPQPAVASEGTGEGGGEGGLGAIGGPKKPAGRQLKGPDKQLRAKITQALNSDPDQVKQLFLSWVESGGGD